MNPIDFSENYMIYYNSMPHNEVLSSENDTGTEVGE